jgi:hypothetical protein
MIDRLRISPQQFTLHCPFKDSFVNHLNFVILLKTKTRESLAINNFCILFHP